MTIEDLLDYTRFKAFRDEKECVHCLSESQKARIAIRQEKQRIWRDLITGILKIIKRRK